VLNFIIGKDLELVSIVSARLNAYLSFVWFVGLLLVSLW
jgi:hypothetical protein